MFDLDCFHNNGQQQFNISLPLYVMKLYNLLCKNEIIPS